jgi:hypothetical protein
MHLSKWALHSVHSLNQNLSLLLINFWIGNWNLQRTDDCLPIQMHSTKLCFHERTLQNKTYHSSILTAATELSLVPSSKWDLTEKDLMVRFVLVCVFANNKIGRLCHSAVKAIKNVLRFGRPRWALFDPSSSLFCFCNSLSQIFLSQIGKCVCLLLVSFSVQNQ